MSHNFKLTLHGFISIIAGCVFIYLAMLLHGIGAAIYVPESVLRPMYMVSPTFALFLVTLDTVGIPMAICFGMYTWLLKIFIKTINYYLIAVPYLVFLVSGFLQYEVSSNDDGFSISQGIAINLPLLLCVYLFGKSGETRSGA
ncbi:hypothetical protein EXU34_13755 [Alteromonas sp. ZYF713]|nr:hypothetical protein [Alteromonas sp. ZYF713]